MNAHDHSTPPAGSRPLRFWLVLLLAVFAALLVPTYLGARWLLRL